MTKTSPKPLNLRAADVAPTLDDGFADDAALAEEIGASKGNTLLRWRVAIRPFPEPL